MFAKIQQVLVKTVLLMQMQRLKHTIYSVYISTFDQLTLVNVIFGNTNIFEYSNNFDTNIYSDIHSYQIF